MSRTAFNRSDTLLGVCEAIGQDLGVHANLLRVAFALGLFWGAAETIALYLALAAVVYTARALTPDRAPVQALPAASVAADNDDEAMALAKAA